MLASVIRRHWHALCRDVIALGRRVSDMFTDKLTFSEMVSIVVGAPPTSSVRFFLDAGWSRESHLLANLQESQAGVAKIKEPYQRPGLDDRIADPTEARFFQADPYTWTEFDELESVRYSGTIKPGRTHVRTI